MDAYNINKKDYEQLSPLAISYIRARNADPKSSFGDFIALSEKVDVCTANLIRREISDGIIAPDYDPEAFKILTKKKGGKYVILKVTDLEWEPSKIEYRELFGIALSQQRNTALTTYDWIKPNNCPTKIKTPNNISTIRDMILANQVLKYTQSNSVCFAKHGQVIGLAAGQQSRIDCVKLVYVIYSFIIYLFIYLICGYMYRLHKRVEFGFYVNQNLY